MNVFSKDVNLELWKFIMEEDYDGMHAFENDTFQIKPYQWGQNAHNDWHFYHKPSGLKIAWQKYPFKNATANMDVTHEQFRAILYDCMHSVDARNHTKIHKWWEDNNTT